VVSNETVESAVLHDAVSRHAEGCDASALVVAPALTSRVRFWTSDEDRARASAALRVQTCVIELQAVGITATGAVGDSDPLQAIADALAVFDADEIVIATHPEHRSNWLARNVVARAQERFGLPVMHIVVGAERSQLVTA